jgi:hypothetical protein
MKKTILGGAFCLSILVSSVGGYKFYTNQYTNLAASNLLSEDVEALSNTEGLVGKVCKWIAGALACFDVSSDPEPKTYDYSYLAITSHQCKKGNGEWGNQDICTNKTLKAVNPPSNECVAGWNTPCR